MTHPWFNGPACCLIFSLLLATDQGFAQEAGDYDDPAPEIIAKSAFNTCVQLPAGTVVLLETAEKIDAATLSIGKILLFRVSMDVLARGRVVIAGGATAIGRIKSLEAGTYNDPAAVEVDIQYALARDGQQVPLLGNEQWFKASHPGENIALEPGQSLIATVAGAILIRMQ